MNILVIISNESFLDDVLNNNSNYICIDYLKNPTIQILKQALNNKEYTCIIPENFYSIKNIIDETISIKNFNIFKVLENSNIDYFGNRYILSLLFYDITSYIRPNIIELHPIIINKYDLDKLEFMISANKKSFIRYISTSDKIYNKTIFESLELNIHEVKRIFERHCGLEEILVYDYIDDFHFIDFIIIGNPPYSVDLFFSDSNDKHYENIINLIKEKSYELFIKYHLRDYAKFSYIFKNKKIFMVNIDISNIFMETTHYFIKKYSINVLLVYLLVYSVRIKNLANLKKLYKCFFKTMNSELFNKLVPFDLKNKINISYNYINLVDELKKRILTTEEKNRYQLITMLNSAIDSLPNIEYNNYPFLGNRKYNYSFLKKYSSFPSVPQDTQYILNESLKILNGQVRWHVPTSLHNVDPSIMFCTVIASTIVNLYNPCTMSSSGSAGILKMEKQIIKQFSKLIEWNDNNSGGIFTYGGKFCLIYAVKCGLNRIKNFNSEKKEPVVITSTINHYSIELVCEILGLKSTSVIRIPINKKGVIDYIIFEKVIINCIKKNIPIACVVFSGGNTTHCTIEDIKTGNIIINNIFSNNKIKYRPFIYYDTVVCWPWLFFKNYDFKKNHLCFSEKVSKEIQKISSLICDANCADGIGIDFHKLGFSPLNNSLFLVKDKIDLYSFTGKNITNIKEPYQYSIDNSRGGTAIISAWNVLQSTGIDGFRSYIANLLEVKYILKKELAANNFILIEEENTHGLALIFLCICPLIKQRNILLLSDLQIKENNHYLYQLSEFLKSNQKISCNLRFLPNYIINKSGQENISVLSILPMTLHINQNTAKMIVQFIVKRKKHFDENISTDFLDLLKNIPDEEPK